MHSRVLLRILVSSLVAAAVLAPVVGSAHSASYTYDKLNRLTSATIDGSRIEYVYDAAGNITRVLTPFSVAVAISGGGTGTVTDDLGKIDCGDDCSGAFDLDAVVTLTATPSNGSAFAGWSGACSGADSCVIPVAGVTSVTASFTPPAADLGITKTDGLDVVAPGGTVTYTIVVSNTGPGLAADASVSDSFPGTQACDWTSSASGGASGSAGSGSGALSETLSLPASSSVTYAAECVVDPAATGTLSNTASVSASASDPATGDNTATDTTELTPEADLWLAATGSATGSAPGGAITYTLDVGNRGPSRATSLVVEDVLPSGAALDTATGAGWSCGEVGGVVTCARPSLSPSTATQIELAVTMPSVVGSTVNSAAVTSATAEAAAGDESDSVSVEIFGPPTIAGVVSVAATETGSIDVGTPTSSAITQLLLEASHELDTPTNPSHFRLFIGDDTGAFTSSSCADPTDVAINSVSYGEAGTDTAALVLDRQAGLSAAWYRLVACGEGVDALQDVYGSELDGNADGTGGDDFQLDFQVQVTNLLVNPNFDTGLAGWTVTSEAIGHVSHDPLSDASSGATSGSARLVNLTGTGSVLALSQCVAVTGGETYVIRGLRRSVSLGATFPEVSVHLESFDQLGCGGSSLGAAGAGTVTGDTAGSWLPAWNAALSLPASAQSGLVTFQVSGNEENAESWLDDLQLFQEQLSIFSDDFETGDTAHWSTTVGPL